MDVENRVVLSDSQREAMLGLTIVSAQHHSARVKGGSQSSHRTLALRPDDQDPSLRPRPGMSRALCPHRRLGRRHPPRQDLSLKAYLLSLSLPIPPMTPTTSGGRLPKESPLPSSPTIPRAPACIRSMSISTLSDISSNAASQNSSSSAVSPLASRKLHPTILPPQLSSSFCRYRNCL